MPTTDREKNRLKALKMALEYYTLLLEPLHRPNPREVYELADQICKWMGE